MNGLLVPPSVLYAKPAVRSRDGLAAAQSRDAAAAGARILAQGGHAVDAAVAVSFALGAVEPWMSGLGGGGFATLWDATKREVRCLDYGMIAPQGIDPADYPLTGGATTEGFFGWPGVLEDRNILGPHSIAVPGLVSGLALAHRTYGRLPWSDLVQPAIALAERGLSLDWYGALSLLVEAKGLARFEATRNLYLPGGRVPQPFEEGAPVFLKLGRLIDTLKKLASPDGPERFYRGDIAADLIRDLQAAGSKITHADLERYQARFIDPVEIAYRGAKVFAPSGLTAGPTLKRVLGEWSERLPAVAKGEKPGAAHYAVYAEALDRAYRDRLQTMGASDSETRPSCTSHFCVADKDGNVVAWTQTLLSRFGSFVLSPSTGILMNNGIMWFDPVPGKPNSIRPGARPLSNMCPTVALSPQLGALAIGASGGRKIMPAVAQILSFLADFGMDLDGAFHCPRIDVSGGEVALIDRRLDPSVLKEIGKSMRAELTDLAPYPAQFANPSATQAAPDGVRLGATDLASPSSGAVAPSDLL
ncbi:gamma-glutamyltransferase family protein [Dongia deserti]|uniref:gamma-glutamyltransferase family protein n=1 Tax=Dongia deserti TaxID=2268030 RepID=UPI000E656C87|nr:gamma-glutamyltransferase [Dongia deserti]